MWGVFFWRFLGKKDCNFSLVKCNRFCLFCLLFWRYELRFFEEGKNVGEETTEIFACKENTQNIPNFFLRWWFSWKLNFLKWKNIFLNCKYRYSYSSIFKFSTFVFNIHLYSFPAVPVGNLNFQTYLLSHLPSHLLQELDSHFLLAIQMITAQQIEASQVMNPFHSVLPWMNLHLQELLITLFKVSLSI